MLNYYFAFGSNMNPERVRERGLEIQSVQAGVLHGYKLVFNKVSASHPDHAHANVIYKPKSQVEGVLYEFFSANEIIKMDVFENAPINYSREVVEINCGTSTIAAWTYFANAGVIQWNKCPTVEYLGHLLAGQDYLSDGYFNWLTRQPTTND